VRADLDGVVPQQNRFRPGNLIAGLAPILLIAGLVLLHAFINWLWLADNVTITGIDKSGHLTRSLNYHLALSPLTLRGTFATLVDNPIRPSLFPISATLAYRLLGFSVDAGPMINLLYMAILLSSTYGLGVKLAGRNVGLLSTVLVGTYPMVYAMSRYFYQEFALAAMVTASIYFLVASDGFQNRIESILFGLCLGLGLLTKRTYVVFVLVPVAYVVLRSKLLASLWQRLTNRPRVHWRALIVATAGGALLAGLWFFPNRESIAELMLGDWLFLLWWFLAALTIYLIALPPAPVANLLGSLSLGASLASVWYLARIEFILRAAGFAYGSQGPEGRDFAWLDPYTYSYYLHHIVIEHISSLYAAFALLAGGILLLLWFRRRAKPAMAWWVLICWVIGAYILMTFTLYRQSRAILPILPPIALLTAAGLLLIPWRRLRSVLLSLMLIGGFLQLAVLSFTPLHGVAEATRWGTVSLFARGAHILWPDYGHTDPGWAIHDDLLQRLESVRQSAGSEALRLGLLASTTYLNSTQFQPLILTSYPSIVVEGLTQASDKGEPAYPLLFDYDFVGLKRNNRFVSDTERAIIDRLLSDPPPAFTQAFELDMTYPLPDGDTLYLYRRRDFSPENLDPTYVSDLVGHLSTVAQPGDAILLDTPAMLAPTARHLADSPTYYQWPLTDDDLSHVVTGHQRIFAIDWEAVPSDYTWLDRYAHLAASAWFGDIHLSVYGASRDLVEYPSGAEFGQVYVLEQYALPEEPLVQGDLLPFQLVWRADTVPGDRHKVFAHLLASDGRLVAQYDGEPVGGTRPTTDWTPGERVLDRRGILLPADLAEGSYTLVVGWYPVDGGDRLPVVSAGKAPLGDQLELGSIQVVSR
jgi:4-amino-4-deoxy-L-arabinose transferase-like glycosyltransferase